MTAPLFEDECNSMDPISAMVSGRPPFPVVGVDSSGTGLMDCPSPPSGRPGDGPLDGLCESWEEGEEETTGVTAGAFSFAPVGTASLQAFRQTFDDLGGGGAGIQGEMPEAARVGGFIPSVEREYLSASAPAAVSSSPFGLPQAHATATASAVNVQQAPEDTTALSAEDVPCPASATPPPIPPKRTGGTTAFVVKERSAAAAAAAATDPLALLYDVSGEADAAATVTPGAVSSQDLLLEWLRREAGHGDEEAQFHLAQLFSPPRFEMKPECRDCGEPFGVTRYRHHCRHCGGSFCHEHAWHEHPIPKLGLPAAQVEWRVVRQTPAQSFRCSLALVQSSRAHDTSMYLVFHVCVCIFLGPLVAAARWTAITRNGEQKERFLWVLTEGGHACVAKSLGNAHTLGVTARSPLSSLSTSLPSPDVRGPVDFSWPSARVHPLQAHPRARRLAGARRVEAGTRERLPRRTSDTVLRHRSGENTRIGRSKIVATGACVAAGTIFLFMRRHILLHL